MRRGFAASLIVLPALLAGVLLLAARGEARAQPGTPAPDFGVGFERPDWQQTAPSQFATVRTRRAAGLLALIPALLFFVLYLYRPRPYLLIWVGAWLLTSLMANLGATAADLVREASRAGPTPHPTPLSGRLLVAAAQLAGITGSALIWFGAHTFREPAVTHRWLIAGIVTIVASFGVTAFVADDVRALLVPGYAVTACVFAGAAVTSVLQARRTRLLGAVVLAAGLTAVAATEVSASALVWLGQAGVEMPNRLILANSVWGVVVMLGMFVLVFEDMTWDLRQTNVDLARAQSELEALAVSDPLTGCFNRRFFDEVVARELKQHRRLRMPLAVIFIDCDRFKAINDTLGHETGDRVLQQIAGVLKSHVRAADSVFRWGGDEFVILFSSDEAQATAKAREIREAFSALPITRDLPPGCGLSFGVIGVPADATDLVPFIQAADQRMYAQKPVTA